MIYVGKSRQSRLRLYWVLSQYKGFLAKPFHIAKKQLYQTALSRDGTKWESKSSSRSEDMYGWAWIYFTWSDWKEYVLFALYRNRCIGIYMILMDLLIHIYIYRCKQLMDTYSESKLTSLKPFIFIVYQVITSLFSIKSSWINLHKICSGINLSLWVSKNFYCVSAQEMYSSNTLCTAPYGNLIWNLLSW